MKHTCWVEFTENRIPIRIFRTQVEAISHPKYEQDLVRMWPRHDAVEAIRRQVLRRANNQCDKCGRRITWGSLHMHERVLRSHGGEISLDNCWALCYRCHNQGGEASEHKGVQWGKNTGYN